MPILSGSVAALQQERSLKLLTIIYCHDVQLCDLFFLLSLSPTKNTGEEGGNPDQDLILGKTLFPKELIPFIIYITVFNKIPHQRTLSHPRDAETRSKLWRGRHITWQRDRGRKAASARRRHKASEDGGGSCSQAVAPSPNLQSRHWFQNHRHYLLRHAHAVSDTTLRLGHWLPERYKYYKEKNATV